MSDRKDTHCWAGRWAFNEGHPIWRTPCQDAMLSRHLVTDPDTPGSPEILLCDRHYQAVLDQDLIDEPEPSPDRLAAYRRRTGR